MPTIYSKTCSSLKYFSLKFNILYKIIYFHLYNLIEIKYIIKLLNDAL
jgi:hypothetical protein